MTPSKRRASLPILLLGLVGAQAPASPAASQTGHSEADAARLVGAMLGATPLVDDLRALTQEIGGRATGSEANLRSVEWSVERFRAAGVEARLEGFMMPQRWLERAAAARVQGEGFSFEARIAAMPFSADTPEGGVTAPLVYLGRGTSEDFARVGDTARDAFVFVETPELEDIDGLFQEYAEAYSTEGLAAQAGVLGVVYMGSRSPGNLYRHNSSLHGDDARPMIVMERGTALRTAGLLNKGVPLSLHVDLDLDTGGPYESFNVIGEIPGAIRPEEVVVVGAHLDSWDLGGGALDNGANVVLLIDIARQMRRVDIRPDRTIRFVLWNGEEQGLVGSWKYTEVHADEMDEHVMAMSFDIGCGRINGFFTGGRPDVVRALETILAPVQGLGPLTPIDVPIVGTDNFDFMMNGVANLVGNHEAATYGPNYHAHSDRIDQCDIQTLPINGAIVAAVTYGFASVDIDLPRQSRAEIERLIATTDLEQQMRSFSVWSHWVNGERGRRR